MKIPQKPECPINIKDWVHYIDLGNYDGCSLLEILEFIKEKSGITDLNKFRYFEDYEGSRISYMANRFTDDEYAKLLEKYKKDLQKYNEYISSEEFLTKKKKNEETHLKRLETQRKNLEKQLKKIDAQLKKQK
jgi:valyl-tRNA synthetase